MYGSKYALLDRLIRAVSNALMNLDVYRGTNLKMNLAQGSRPGEAEPDTSGQSEERKEKRSELDTPRGTTRGSLVVISFLLVLRAPVGYHSEPD